MQCLRREEAQRCICLIASAVIRGPSCASCCGLIMVGCRVRLPLLVIGSAVVLIFSGRGMAVSNERPRRNNRRNNKLPGQEAPEAPLPLGYSRRRSRSRKLGKVFPGKVFTGYWLSDYWLSDLKRLRAILFAILFDPHRRHHMTKKLRLQRCRKRADARKVRRKIKEFSPNTTLSEFKQLPGADRHRALGRCAPCSRDQTIVCTIPNRRHEQKKCVSVRSQTGTKRRRRSSTIKMAGQRSAVFPYYYLACG